MTFGLKRYQTSGQDHAINFCCHNNHPYLASTESRDLFEHSLEQTRTQYRFDIYAYVVMPNHAHLLVSEPEIEPLSKAIQSLKVSVSKQSTERPFWHPRYYDFNILTLPKFKEKLKYIHRNPIRANLVESPEDWPHSSYRTWQTGEQRTVQIKFF
jgi:putative transposase